MNSRVKVERISNNQEEWSKEVTAWDMGNAKGQATKWINKNLFESDYERIEKEEITNHYQVWSII